MIEIDGSSGAGGGQILRTSLALAAILGESFVIRNIRAGRPRPGLMPQHLAGVRAAAQLCQAKVRGDFLNSIELVFEPAGVVAQKLVVDVASEKGSAGSVTLVTQTVLPIMLFASDSCQALLRGGTHVPFSPLYEFLERVLLPFLSRLGYKAQTEIRAYGFYPVGGGEMLLKTEPVIREQLKGLRITDRGALKAVRVVSGVSRLPVAIADRQAHRLKQMLAREIAEIKTIEVPAKCPGSYLFLEAVYEQITAGFSALGSKGKRAEQVADEVYQQFQAYAQHRAALEPHLADQIIPFLGLSRSPFHFTTTCVSAHLKTNIQIVSRFLPGLKIDLLVRDDGTGEVRGNFY
jgi:RNA 3'-terminal phosphate cyclase (ATP)